MSHRNVPELQHRRPHIITLGVHDLARSENFYRQGFHWVLAPLSNENIRFFDMGGLLIALYDQSRLAEEVGYGNHSSTTQPYSGITLAHNVLNAEAVEQLIERLAALGGRVLQPATKADWGGYSGYIADPDGHVWEIAYNPYLNFAEDGSLTPTAPSG
jgi:predicted lactoylglutathione lyase